MIMSELFTTYNKALVEKGITTIEQYQNIADISFAKCQHALYELKTVSADSILAVFFSEYPNDMPNILANIDDHRLNHIGFEIYQPLDVIMHQLDNWLIQLSNSLHTPLTIVRKLRFPASQAFQKRVGASTEILCLWLQSNTQVLMIECFDMAHPIVATLPTCELMGNSHTQIMQYLFQNDRIWHYSVYVENKATIDQLHQALAQLTMRRTMYKLAYPAPIQNKYDGSFHTKLINRSRSFVLEFVTYQNE